MIFCYFKIIVEDQKLSKYNFRSDFSDTRKLASLTKLNFLREN